MAQAINRPVGLVTHADAWDHGFVFTAHLNRQLGFQGALKRLIDVVAASLALFVLAGPMLLIALIIKLDSRGPVLIVQERVGRHLKPFRMYKFRSMVANAPELQRHLMALNEASGPIFKIKRDPRLTRAGRLLRRMSLDETPQLFNVLQGDMSLVGPRPPFAHEVAQDHFRQALRLGGLPGMTGLWQVSGRSNLHYEQMIRLDLDYLEDWSLMRDLEVLVRTPLAVLTGRGAH